MARKLKKDKQKFEGLTVRLSDKHQRQFAMMAKKAGIKKGALIRSVLVDYLAGIKQ